MYLFFKHLGITIGCFILFSLPYTKAFSQSRVVVSYDSESSLYQGAYTGLLYVFGQAIKPDENGQFEDTFGKKISKFDIEIPGHLVTRIDEPNVNTRFTRVFIQPISSKELNATLNALRKENEELKSNASQLTPADLIKENNEYKKIIEDLNHEINLLKLDTAKLKANLAANPEVANVKTIQDSLQSKQARIQQLKNKLDVFKKAKSKMISFLYKYYRINIEEEIIKDINFIKYTFYRIIAFVLITGLGIFIFLNVRLQKKQTQLLDSYTKIEEKSDQLEQSLKAIKEQKEEINSQHEKLSNLQRFQEEQAQMIVHDLKNPVLHVIDLSDTVRNDVRIHEEAKKAMNYVYKAGKRLQLRIQTINELYKLTKGDMVLDIKPNDLFGTAQEVFDLFEYSFKSRGIEFFNLIPPNTIALFDKHGLERVFDNLVGNAIVHSFTHGKITVTLQSSDTDEWSTILVSDTGKGIPEDKLPNIFEPSYSLSGSSGLGLTFCKNMIEKHNSHLKVTSQPEQGTTFFFQLKMVKQPPPLRPPLAHHPWKPRI